MAELPDVFKSDEHEPMNTFEIMPTDLLYLGEITKSEIKKTKAGNGLRLNFQVKISLAKNKDGVISDVYNGRIVFVGLNIKNPNPQAVEISQRELKSLCDAVEVEEIEDSDEVHGIPFGFILGIEKGKDGYADKNVIKKYITEDEFNSMPSEG